MLTIDQARALTQNLSGATSIMSEIKTIKKEIKILTQKQQKQVRDVISGIDSSKLQKIINKIDANIAKIQAKKVKRAKDKKSMQTLEDVKIMILEKMDGKSVVNEDILKPKSVQIGDVISVDYIGTFEDGTVFDSSIEEFSKKTKEYDQYSGRTYEPLSFKVGDGQMIK